MDVKTDLDLPPAYRTQANLWIAKYYEMYKEVVKANKGIKRLKRKLEQQKRLEGLYREELKEFAGSKCDMRCVYEPLTWGDISCAKCPSLLGR